MEMKYVADIFHCNSRGI